MSDDDTAPSNYASEEAEFLVGKTLTGVRPLKNEELKLYGWDEIPQGSNAVAFVFGDTVLIPTSLDGSMPGLFDYLRDDVQIEFWATEEEIEAAQLRPEEAQSILDEQENG